MDIISKSYCSVDDIPETPLNKENLESLYRDTYEGRVMYHQFELIWYVDKQV